MPTRAISGLAIATMALGAGIAAGQAPATRSGPAYPSKPIRIVTSEVGSAQDVAARILSQGLSGPLGQQVIIDNRASGVIPGEIVARARADGYTLLLYGGTFWLQPLVLKKVPYDPVKDFSPITLVAYSPRVLVVHPALPVHSTKELIALAKAKPGELNYAMGAVGSANHLAAELFMAATGVRMTGIGYKGNGPAVAGVLSGEVQLMFATASSVTPHMKSGRLRGLAVDSEKSSALVPDLPTMAAAGVPGHGSASATGLFAPARTPAAIIDRLNRESVRFLNTQEAKERYLNIGAEPVGSSPGELAANMKSEMARMGKVIRDAGIRVE